MHPSRRPQGPSARSSSYTTDDADGLPLLPAQTFSDYPTTPRSSNNQSYRGIPHRPTHLSFDDNPLNISNYKDDPFNPNVLYDPTKYHSNQYNTPNSLGANTPSPYHSIFPDVISKPPQRHPLPFAHSFEYPDWQRLALHIFLVGLAYPALLVFVVVARNKTLFWSRFIIAIGCGGIGFVLALSLLSMAQPFLEASTWATIIHQSRAADSPGIRLRDVAASSQDGTSAWPALRLLWTRWMYTGTARKNRATYDKRPWTLAILFFLMTVILAASLPFLLGRIVSIETEILHQRNEYFEVPVKGDLSVEDIAKASDLARVFNNFAVTWTLSPFSSHGSLPPAISYDWENDSIYFAEATSSQFVEGGTGFGTFKQDTTSPSIEVSNEEVNLATSVVPGSLLRYPRWGVRIHCEKIPNGDVNIIPKSEGTLSYLFTPRETLRSLFNSFDMNLPEIFEAPLDASSVLLNNDTLPDTINPNDISLGAAFYDNGVAHSMKSVPLTMGNNPIEFNGWISVESVLVRLNTTYAPNGVFAHYSASVPDVNGSDTFIGMDAAVCVELFEPYVLETYNATVGLPSTLGIVGRNASILTPEGALEHLKGNRLTDPKVKTRLNSTGLNAVFDTLHGNSVNQLIKDNGRDAYYVPSPTLISFTGAEGPYAYTELSAQFFGKARALADASNMLPYFAGSADTLARRYPDQNLAKTSMHSVYMASLMIVVLCVGILAGLFVPKLPFDIPHRGFEIYSWLAAFNGEELVSTYVGAGNLPKNLEMKDIRKKMGDLKFRYGF